ncbi:TMAO reductase system periplasmic protein TorT [Planosporangium flavigriseum]|uniref:TMAO reductase system periplasmic protein TorT n=2 Tax=Planosporangium flavigriseum TaxID=373681 RepID=A0A8J3LTB8_9ACTN|nr:TMAO reductase system periplasmic protein TorT [Planosporangium flavigriseum]
MIDCDAPDVDPKGCAGKATEGTYTSLARSDVTKPWKICITVPHLKDPIWVAQNYAAVQESRRLGVNMQFHDAGGYTEVTNQAQQVENCTAQKVDAIIVGAVSFDALNPVIESAIDKGIVVIDGGNGISSPKIKTRTVLDYYEMGKSAGAYLAKQGKPAKVALLPGPAGVSWSERSAQGFKDAIAGSPVQIIDTKYGDTAKEVQLKLVEDVLSAHKDVDVIAGTAVTIDVARTVLVERGREQQVKLVATYLIPTTLDLIKSGAASCAPTEQPVITYSMAVDQAVRRLEKKPLDDKYERYAPRPLLVCGPAAGKDNNLSTFDEKTSFAPKGYSPVFKVSP